MDSAKLMCCAKAKSHTCRHLCLKTWSDQWLENWHQFDRICQYSPQEANLIQCLDDVEGVCQSGCQALEFCNTFNNRYNQLYRKCDAKSDVEAKEDFESWMRGVIHFNIIEIPVKNVDNCYPDFWKLIACSIHVKPCLENNHFNNICRSSCIDIISECIDENRIPSTLLSAQTICDIISTNDTLNCIDIKTFLNSNQNTDETGVETTNVLINPCNPNPCSPNQLCLVNSNCISNHCLPFRCVSACRLGEISPFLVKADTIVKLLDGTDECHHMCKCGPRGRLIECLKTYPNYCYAKCNGFSDEEYVDGSCDTIVECVKCNQNQKCIKKSQVCLTSDHCPQYECIADPMDCQLFGTNPVCDTNGVNHQNLCWLLKKKQKFAYYGKCLYYCSSSGPVCAMNGQTYESECVSLSHSVPVDYYSKCNHTNDCHHIQCPLQAYCPHQHFRHSLQYTCCQFCGSVAKLQYETNAIDRIERHQMVNYAVTVEELAKHLSHLIRLYGCQSFTHLDFDGYLVLMVRPIAISPTISQLNQCHRELIRVVTLINNQSPWTINRPKI
ncbi:unnamed protein product [Medioppia subpectinata]|uniref:Kazal-like domain-containing protein n=1 Tax=Medioppia subpectinata TaxID=1979941 RepID=A0A7R9KCA8_9ACAR|nr:unnamed protein product [Medioppia subpectinata]CAG2100831.1 unnamed protein product [Medioppia subpectinata]